MSSSPNQTAGAGDPLPALPVLLVTLLAACAACNGGASEEPTPRRHRPLQPLVYTEDPDLSPEAAAVRERRLMRRLLQGSTPKGAVWGRLDDGSGVDLPNPKDAEVLGRLLYRAIVEQRDPHWDHIFVAPRGYAALVNVGMEKARKFVDTQQADAREARRAFSVESASKRPRKGLASVFDVRRLELGEGRKMDGSVAHGDQVAVQHWDNVLYLGLDGSQLEFRLEIPKILRLQRPGSERSSTELGIASDIRIGPRLEVFLGAGMHLKPELLRSFEYPIPLAVGNYWRYRRRLRGRPTETSGESSTTTEAPETTTPPPSELPEGLNASELTVKVTSVDRYDSRRLVKLRLSYNDEDLTRRSEFWLATPHRVYLCPSPCRRHIDDLEWLLSYLRRQSPIFRFPLGRGDTWGEGSNGAGTRFRVDDSWHELETPAGSFFGAIAIRGLGPLEHRVPDHQLHGATRFLAPGKGVVRRTYRIGPDPDDAIVETLLDYRLMPR